MRTAESKNRRGYLPAVLCPCLACDWNPEQDHRPQAFRAFLGGPVKNQLLLPGLPLGVRQTVSWEVSQTFCPHVSGDRSYSNSSVASCSPACGIRSKTHQNDNLVESLLLKPHDLAPPAKLSIFPVLCFSKLDFPAVWRPDERQGLSLRWFC